MRTQNSKGPKILVVTPEITYLPEGMYKQSSHLSAKAAPRMDCGLKRKSLVRHDEILVEIVY